MSFEPAEALGRLNRCTREGRIAHAYLIAGPVATAEQEVVLPWLAALLGSDPAHHPDVFRVAPLSRLRRIKIEQIRQLGVSLNRTSMLGGWKAALIIEADRLGPEASNAFLKTLEEPAARTVIFLLSASPDQLLPTIRSRCLTVRLRTSTIPEPPADLQPLLDAVTQADPHDLVAAYRCLNRFVDHFNSIRSRLDDAADELVKQAREQGLDSDNLDDFERLQAAHAHSDYLLERRNILACIAAALAATSRPRALLIEQACRDLARPLPEILVLERLFLKLFPPAAGPPRARQAPKAGPRKPPACGQAGLNRDRSTCSRDSEIPA